MKASWCLAAVALAAVATETVGEMDNLAEYSQVQISNATLLWGTYRPNLYFGLRPRVPSSITAGLLWNGLSQTDAINGECAVELDLGKTSATYSNITCV